MYYMSLLTLRRTTLLAGFWLLLPLRCTAVTAGLAIAGLC
jgi:hypothetical protein